MIDWTLSVSTILQILAMCGTVLGLYYGMRGEVRVLRHDVRHIEQRLEGLSESFKGLSSVLTQVAVQDNRLNMVEKAIDDLRHGHGFIKTTRNKI